jgi:enoyl-CoA hydratase
MPNELLQRMQGKVLVVTVNRPEARNALSVGLAHRLADALRYADDDPGVGAVVLTGSDPAFCAGVDFEVYADQDYGRELLVDPTRSPWRALRSMNTVVIGAINGPAVTAGLELALSCGFLVASEYAAFADTYAEIGMHPGGGITSLLPEAIGVRRAREMSATGRFMNATEAHECGLVNRVVPHAELMTCALELAARVTENDPKMVQLINGLYRDTASTTKTEGLTIEEKGYRNRELNVKTLLARYRAKGWKKPAGTPLGEWKQS